MITEAYIYINLSELYITFQNDYDITLVLIGAKISYKIFLHL